MHQQLEPPIGHQEVSPSHTLELALNSPEMLARSTWLVSYPRSGNTFMRALLANYLSGKDEPLTLHELHFSSFGEHVQEFWQDLLGKPPVERTFEEEFARRGDYFGILRQFLEGKTKLIKSHTPNVDLNGTSAFQLSERDRVVHIVRHPCDVAISFSHYFNVDIDEAIRRLNTDMTLHNGHPVNGYEFIGSWRLHTQSWMDCRAAPVLQVKYFDMVQNTAKVLARVIEFMGYPVDPGRVALAVEFSRFGRLREQEQGGDFVENASQQPFFRMGVPGKWMDTLTVDQARRVVNANAEMMERLGFMRLFVS